MLCYVANKDFDASTPSDDTESLKRIILEQQGHFDKERENMKKVA